MKQIIKTTLVLVMFVLTAANSVAQDTNDKKWVPLSYMCSKMTYELPIYDVRVNTKVKSKLPRQDMGIIFGRGGNKWAFLNTSSWTFNLTNNALGGVDYKVSKSKPDSEKMRHPDFSHFGGVPFYFVSYEKNALMDEVQALVDLADYYFLTNQNYYAMECYRTKAQSGDNHSKYMLASLLEKGSVSEQKEAFQLFQELSQSGYSRANFNLFKFYDEGEIVPKDNVKAKKLLRMCGKKKYLAAQEYANGFLYNTVGTFPEYYYDLVFGEHGYFLNKIIKAKYTNDYKTPKPTFDGFKKFYTWAIPEVPGRHLTPDAFLYSVKNLLESGDCDWMWVDVPMRYLVTFQFINVKDKSIEQRACNIIDKWCDIALNTSDIELLNKLCYRVWKEQYDYGKESVERYIIKAPGCDYYGCYGDFTFLVPSKKTFTFKEVVHDEEVLNKADMVLKRAVEMGNEEWIRVYEKEMLSK